MPVRRDIRSIFVVRKDQVQKIDRLAERSGKTRSAVVREAIDRLLSPPVPDVIEPLGSYQDK